MTRASTWLTPETFVRLQQELDNLLEQARQDAGDSRSPDEFDATAVVVADRRNTRIRQLRELLHNAVVGKAPPDDGVAEPGMVLTVRFDDSGETLEFLLGVRDSMNTGGLESYSHQSPLGVALDGAKEGEQRTYTLPNGSDVRVTLLRATPYSARDSVAEG